MALQDDINNLTQEIASEEQSATILDGQVTSEQQTSTQKVQSWQQQASRHRDAATRMGQELQAKQRELIQEQEREAEEARKADEKAKEVAKGIARQMM